MFFNNDYYLRTYDSDADIPLPHDRCTSQVKAEIYNEKTL